MVLPGHKHPRKLTDQSVYERGPHDRTYDDAGAGDFLRSFAELLGTRNAEEGKEVPQAMFMVCWDGFYG